MKYIDVHTHVQFPQFDTDRDDVIKRAQQAEVGMIQVGTSYDTSVGAVSLAGMHKDMFATVGLHPTHTDHSAGRAVEGFNAKLFRDLAQDEHVVAIGECGLDYYRLDTASKKVQKDVFEAQIALSIALGKPLMLHIRDAYQDAYEILKIYPNARGNVHFFAGNWDAAQLFLSLGCTLSFTGVITFTNDYNEVIKNMPIDSILSETDAPYVAPVPHRGKRNEPSYVTEVVSQIATIRNTPEEKIRESILKNAEKVFGMIEKEE